MTSLDEKLAGWTGPSSASEQDQQGRTERMIREAIDAHEPFASLTRKVYAKGSYANNTNVRSDSDVDIAVLCQNVFYYDGHIDGAVPADISPYSGEWTPVKLRSELIAALRTKFGSDVDTSGSTAIQVHSSSARVEADVVPSFDYRYYFAPDRFREGSRVFKTDNSHTENYSALQLANGRAKNNRTNQAYKKTVRIMKRLENAMVEAGYHREVPSYFVECLVYNSPDEYFTRSTWSATVKAVVARVYSELEGSEPSENDVRWVEVNEAKYLFLGAQKWTRTDGRDFAYAAWNFLALGDA